MCDDQLWLKVQLLAFSFLISEQTKDELAQVCKDLRDIPDDFVCLYEYVQASSQCLDRVRGIGPEPGTRIQSGRGPLGRPQDNLVFAR